MARNVESRQLPSSTAPTLWPHQKASKTFFNKTPRAFDFSDPGVGKTRIHAEVFADRKQRKRLLVVCPKTLMYAAWGADIERFAPTLTVSFATAEQREAAFKMKTDVVILNTDGVKWFTDKNKKEQARRRDYLLDFDHLIIDEVTNFKTPTSLRSKAMAALRGYFKYRYALTGTPTANSVMELFFPSLIINDGKILGDSYFRMRSHFQESTQIGPGTQHLQWNDKPGAEQAVTAMLDPVSIRHSFEDVMTHVPANHRSVREFTLSPTAMRAYREMETTCMLAHDDPEQAIDAIHAAALRTKLLQIACIEAGTEVLTARGWVPIERVSASDKVWDGIEWVATLGGICSGDKPTVMLDGIRMTPNHKVMTNSGWQQAEDILNGDADERFNRTTVRLPDDTVPSRPSIERMHALDDTLRLRERNTTHWRQYASNNTQPNKVMRVQTWRAASGSQTVARADATPVVCSMGEGNLSMPQQMRQRLSKLRSTWNNGMRALAQVVLQFLGRHGAVIQEGAYAGAHQQQQGLFAEKLSMGNSTRTEQQHAQQYLHRDTKRTHDASTGSGCFRSETNNSVPTLSNRRPVYDVVEAGPRHRFVVRNKAGKLLIVHNSGAVYSGGEDSAYRLIDTQRYDLITEMVENVNHSVVFFNWKHQREQLSKTFAAAKISFALIDGSVPQSKRDEIVVDYQAGKYQTILLHPRTGAHGLTLTRGTTTIVASPIYEADLLKQGIHRIYRGDQRQVTNTILVQAKGTVEDLVYAKLDAKTQRMDDFLSLVKNRIKK